MSRKPELTLFYDGQCPICLIEIRHLQKYNQAGRLRLEDIRAADFSDRYPHIPVTAADQLLHAQWADGDLEYGLDASCQAWHVVGKGHWFAFLRWPLIRPLADAGYRLFARHRHWLARRLFPRSACRYSESSCARSENCNRPEL